MTVFNNFNTPVVVTNDLELAKTVLINDFDPFSDRRPFPANGHGKLSEATQRMMLNLEGEVGTIA